MTWASVGFRGRLFTLILWVHVLYYFYWSKQAESVLFITLHHISAVPRFLSPSLLSSFASSISVSTVVHFGRATGENKASSCFGCPMTDELPLSCNLSFVCQEESSWAEWKRGLYVDDVVVLQLLHCDIRHINNRCNASKTWSTYRPVPFISLFHCDFNSASRLDGSNYSPKEASEPSDNQNRKRLCFPRSLSPGDAGSTVETLLMEARGRASRLHQRLTERIKSCFVPCCWLLQYLKADVLDAKISLQMSCKVPVLAVLCHLVLLHGHRKDGGHGVRRESQLTVLAQREAGRLEVSRAEAGVHSQRALVPLSHRQPQAPLLCILRKPAGCGVL